MLEKENNKVPLACHQSDLSLEMLYIGFFGCPTGQTYSKCSEVKGGGFLLGAFPLCSTHELNFCIMVVRIENFQMIWMHSRLNVLNQGNLGTVLHYKK